MTPRFAAWLLSLPLVLASCELNLDGHVEANPELLEDRFGRTAKPVPNSKEPVTVKEVSFHIRMSLPEAELIAEAEKRGFVADGDPQSALQGVGAHPRLIAQLTAKPVLLTPEERALYSRRMVARTNQITVAAQDSEAFLQQRKLELNDSMAAARRRQVDAQVAELNARAAQIRREQRRERCSTNSNSPYQKRQQEIDQIHNEVTALQKQLR